MVIRSNVDNILIATNGTNGQPGAAGTSSYIHIKYSNDGGQTFTSNSGETIGAYIGIYRDFTEVDSNNVADYQWKKIEGEDGEPAYTVMLSNENFTISTDTSYVPIHTQNFTCGVTVLKGSNPVGFTITSSADTENDIVTTVSGNTVSIAVAPVEALSATQGVITLTITTTDNHTFTKDVTWSVATQGRDGQPGSSGVSITDVTNYYLATIADSGVTKNTTGWTTTIQNMTERDPYLWNYEVITGSNGTTISSTDPVIIGRYGRDGAAAAEGRGIYSIVEHYQVSASNTTPPTTWSDTPVVTDNTNKYLWNYETITYTDNTSEDTQKRVIGTHGTPGTNGASVTISSTSVQYAISASATVTPSEWGDLTEATAEAPYLWTKTVVTYSDNTSTTSYSVSRQGTDGIPGRNGIDGTSTYVHIKYSLVPNPTDADLTETPSDYIGICHDSNVTDPTTASSYTWVKWQGHDGENGQPGQNGIDGTSSYTHFAYSTSADGSEDFSTTTFSGAKYLGVLVDNTLADSTVYSDYTWTLIKGEDGINGTSITNVINYYLATPLDSGVTKNTQGWTTAIQEIDEDKQYLWNYEEIIGTGNTTISSTAPVIIGRYGRDGAAATEGRGITSITEHYQTSASNVTAPTTWSDSPVATNETNKYLWNYETITYTDATTHDTSPRVIGTHGTPGTSVTVSSTQYQEGTSSITPPSGVWENSPVIVSNGNYLWTKVTYSDGTVAYSIARQGADGNSVTVTNIEYAYKLSTSGTVVPTGSWETTPQAPTTTQYAWTRTTTTFSDGSTAVTYAVGGKTGGQGQKGDNGRGIVSITEYFLLSTTDDSSQITFPEKNNKHGWTTVGEALIWSRERPVLWHCTEVVYENPDGTRDYEYIDKYPDTGWKAADLVQSNLTSFQQGVDNVIDRDNQSIRSAVWENTYTYKPKTDAQGNYIYDEHGKIVPDTDNTRTMSQYMAETIVDMDGITSRVASTESDIEGVDTRLSQAESTITQHADSIESKVSKDGVISSINQSAEQITIDADRVNISGAAIFTSGRLSESSLNNAYDANGAAEQAKVDAIAEIPTDISELNNDAGYQTASDVSGAIGDATNGLLSNVTTKTQYYLSTSSTSAKGGSWQDTVPTWSSGKYIWTRVATTKTPVGGTATTTYSTGVYDSALTTALSDLQNKAETTDAVSSVVTTQEYYLSSSASGTTGGSWSSSFPTWSSGKYIWTRFKIVKTPISGNATTSYSPSEAGVYNSTLTTALSTANSAQATANAAAPKTDAVYRQQRIYYRKTSSGAPSKNTTWLTTSGTGYGNWSLSIPPLTSGTTKYPYLYTAVQTQTVAQQASGATSNNCSCSNVLIDDTTTIIDGGNIITGTVTAREITADNLQGDHGWINLKDGKFYYGDNTTFANSDNAISWNGSKLQIKADEFLLASGKSIFDEIEAIETWFYATAPTTSNAPASSWTTDNLKEMHLRDIYFDTNSGKSYRWAKDGSTYKWVEIEDKELSALAGRVSSAETAISSNTEQIALRATKTEVSQSITDEASARNDAIDDAIAQEVVDRDAAIQLSADSITSSVSSTYETKTDASAKLSEAKEDATTKASAAEANAKADTTNKLKSYYTKTETDSQITQKAGEITSAVSETYETKTDASSKLTEAKGYTDTEVGSAKTEIKQTTDSISSRVTKTEAKIAGHYATSSTAAGTAAKVATITPSTSDWELYTGASVTVKFTNANTNASPTLNVNGKGAKAIKSYTGANLSVAEYKWSAGAALTFVYNGTNWLMQDSGVVGRVASAETTITQNSEAIALRATKTEAQGYANNAESNAKTYADTAVSTAKSEIKVTTDGISSEVSKISSAKYIESSTASWTLANIKTWATEGRSQSFNVTSTENLRVGDTVYIKGTDSTRSCPVYIKITVTAINSATKVTGTAHGYEDVIPVDTIKSTINQSSDSVKIQAKHVDIEGAAIFSSGGRLSEASLDAAYDANGAASAAEANAKGYVDGKGYATTSDLPTKVSDLTNDSGFQTASQVSNAVSSGVSGKADKTDAVKQTQRIYYRSNSTTAPTAPSTWVTSTATANSTWTTKRMEYDSTYKYLYTCIQKQTVSGTVTCTTVLLDDTTTVIDGGNIITGTVTANKIAAHSISANKLAITDGTNLAQANELVEDSMPGRRWNGSAYEEDGTSFANGYKLSASNGYLVKRSATQTYMMFTDFVPSSFRTGDELYYEFYAKAESETTVRAYVYGYTAPYTSSTCNNNNGENITVTTTEQKFSGTIKLTASKWDTDAKYYLLVLYNNATTKVQIYVRKVIFRKKSAGELIVDGSITAKKIDVNDLFAQNINATGTITGAELIGANGKFTRGFDVNLLFDFADGTIIDDESEATGDTVSKYFHIDRDSVCMGYNNVDFLKHYRNPAHPTMQELTLQATYVKLLSTYLQMEGLLTLTGALSASENISALGYKLVYEAGDVVDCTGVYAGNLTSSNKQVQFFIPLPKPRVAGIHATLSGNWVIRHSDGGYILNNAALTSIGTITTLSAYETGVYVTLTLTNASSFTNNCPVSVFGTNTARLTFTS